MTLKHGVKGVLDFFRSTEQIGGSTRASARMAWVASIIVCPAVLIASSQLGALKESYTCSVDKLTFDHNYDRVLAANAEATLKQLIIIDPYNWWWRQSAYADVLPIIDEKADVAINVAASVEKYIKDANFRHVLWKACGDITFLYARKSNFYYYLWLGTCVQENSTADTLSKPGLFQDLYKAVRVCDYYNTDGGKATYEIDFDGKKWNYSECMNYFNGTTTMKCYRISFKNTESLLTVQNLAQSCSMMEVIASNARIMAESTATSCPPTWWMSMISFGGNNLVKFVVVALIGTSIFNWKAVFTKASGSEKRKARQVEELESRSVSTKEASSARGFRSDTSL